MPPPEKASEESPGSKELRRIQDVRRRKRVREAEEALEEEEEARRKLEEQKTLGLANPKKKIKKASGKTSKEGDPKKNPKSQQEKPLPEPKKIRVDSRVDKESFKRVRDAIAKTVVTDSQVDDVPPPGAHASDGSEEGAHTSDSESVDSSLTSGSEEQTSLKKLRSSNSQVVLLKAQDLLDKTSDVSKIENFGNKVSHMNDDDGSLASNFLSENLKSQIMVTLLAYQGSPRLLASCRGISLVEESQVEDLTPKQIFDMLMFLHELGNDRGVGHETVEQDLVDLLVLMYQFLRGEKERPLVEVISKVRQRLKDSGAQQEVELHARVWSYFVENGPTDLCEESKHLLTIAKQYLGKGHTLPYMLNLLLKEVIANHQAILAVQARKISMPSKQGGSENFKPSGPKKGNPNPNPKAKAGNGKVDSCNCCGRPHKGGYWKCQFRDWHPSCNKDASTSWAESSQGKAYKARGLDTLDPFTDSKGNKVDKNALIEKKKKGTSSSLNSIQADHKKISFEGHALCCGISSTLNQSANNPNSHPPIREVRGFVDTGAIGVNLISREAATWLLAEGTPEVKGKRVRLNTVHGSSTLDTEIEFNLHFFDNYQMKNSSLPIIAIIFDKCPYDLIIGRHFLNDNKMLEGTKLDLEGDKFSSYLATSKSKSEEKYATRKTSTSSLKLCITPPPSPSLPRWENPEVLKYNEELSVLEKISTGKKDEKKQNNKRKKHAPPLPEIVDPKWLDLEEKLENVLKKNLAEEIARKNLEQELERVKKALEGKSERSPGMTPPTIQKASDGSGLGSLEDGDEVMTTLHYLLMLTPTLPKDLRFELAALNHLTKGGTSVPENLKKGRVSKETLLDPIDDDDYIDYDESLPWEPEEEEKETDEFHFPIEANTSERKHIEELLSTYSEVFSSELNKEPAKLDPLVLKVNDDEWRIPQHRSATRYASHLKQAEIERQVEKMLSMNLVQASQNPEKSQVILVKKPDGTFRFCIDYRSLNNATESMGWPIPNIPQMLQRIGMKKPKYFAVMDFTKGFYQAPLAEESRGYTTFTTWMGNYEWLRVPMGIKGAPSWFQQQIETKVLGGLIHHICELYIDDVIVYADTYEQYVENLTKVLDRFREYGITISPKKCKFLVDKIEYVGYEINKDGIRFTQRQKDKVLDFPLPKTKGGLKSFVGLAEYFHSHVKEFATLARPLHALLHGYEKKRKSLIVPWDEESKKSYYDLQQAIGNCQMLYFPDPNGEIFLETDASDYGIGAYLYQKGDELDEQGIQIQKPIAFISKNLVDAQLRWSTPEKEAYGIFYAITHLEHLLRDVHFVLRTDHKNLTYINYGNSQKILRWKMQIQEYDFEIEHVAGEENIIADAFSRLLEAKGKDEIHELMLLKARVLPMQVKKIPNDKYKIISSFHNTTVGHFGLDSTFEKLTESGYHWPHMREHVRLFIKRCPSCQRLDQRKPNNHVNPFVLGSYEPMDKVAVDTMGPYSKDHYGNRYVVVFTDCFSRFVMLIPTKTKEAKEIGRALMQWHGMFGAPKRLLSDKGTEYINKIISSFLELMHTSEIDILPGIKEQNSIVERRNKEVIRHIRQILDHTKVKDHWSDAAPLVQRIMNSNKISSIGTTPARIIFGESVDLNRGLKLQISKEDSMQPKKCIKRMDEWVSTMAELQHEIVKLAQEQQKQIHEEHFESGSLNRTTFDVDSLVLVNYGDSKDYQPPTKFHSFWRGPWRVVEIDSEDPNRYTLEHLVTLKKEDFDLKNLKSYHYDEEQLDCPTPYEAAQADLNDNQDIVEKILSHHGEIKRPNKLTFEVKWVDEEGKTTESYSNLKTNECLHDYLRNLGGEWEKLIPMQYTYEGQHFTETNPKPKPASKIQPDISKKKNLKKKGTPTRFSKRRKI